MPIRATPPRPGVHPWPMDGIPDPEVPERPTRRRFSAAYKVAVLDELDAGDPSKRQGRDHGPRGPVNGRRWGPWIPGIVATPD